MKVISKYEIRKGGKIGGGGRMRTRVNKMMKENEKANEGDKAAAICLQYSAKVILTVSGCFHKLIFL